MGHPHLGFIHLLQTIENKFGPPNELNNLNCLSHCWSNRHHQTDGDPRVVPTHPRSIEICNHNVSEEVWKQNIIHGMLHQNLKIESSKKKQTI